jgi:tyrosine-specific transport protein
VDSNQKASIGTFFSAMLLVAGTCIGGGMLALPVATGVTGFFPSMLMMGVCWAAMTASALLLLEASLWMPEGAHVITISSVLLGKIGKIVSWCVYLFISYASIVAYTAGGGGIITQAAQTFFDYPISKFWSCLIFILLFGSIIDLGTHIVGRVNAILFIAMIAAYFALVGMALPEIKPALLTLHQHWSGAILAIPLLLTSFSFQTMVPSLTPYLKKHAKQLRYAIIGGTAIAFLVYAIWQALVLGIVPVQGSKGLAEALSQGEPVTQFLREHVASPWVSAVADFFAFFALVTSFLGMALGLFDFLSDGLKIPKRGWGKLILGLLIILPTLVFAVGFERIFLLALDTSGGFGDSILNGIMPVLMVWVGRYYMGFSGEKQLAGGKWSLAAVFLFFISALGLELLVHTKCIPSVFDLCNYFL